MSEENLTKVLQMISTAGTARAKYMEAIGLAKTYDFEKAEKLMNEGSECFKMAHDVHSDFLASASADLAASGNSDINLILVHAEDQMMCAETFRLMAEELIDVYKNIKSQDK